MAKIYSFQKRGETMQAVEMKSSVTSIENVAKLFLTYDSMTHKKLQKLCYYAYAWHLTLLKKPLFNEKFQAWVHGPVSPELYQQYKNHGWREIPQVNTFSTEDFDSSVSDLIDAVYASYGHLSGDELELLTHEEAPWLSARNGLPNHAPSQEVIKDEVIGNYYSKLFESGQND